MKSIDKINKAANKQIVFFGADSPHKDIEPMSCGIESVDTALVIGGFPKGRISEIFGLPGVAKTSFALWMIGVQQKEGKTCAFVDAECALDLDFAEKLGVDTDKLIIIQGDCGEENLEAVETLLRDNAVDLVVIDSVPSLVPRSEIEAEMNKPQMGGQARMLASGLRKLVPLCAKSGAVILFINQQRVNIMGGYAPYTTPGGMALRFYSSVRIELKRGNAISISGGKSIDGYQIKFMFKKNKVGKPSVEVTADFLFDGGFTSEVNILDIGAERGILRKDGNTFYYGEQKLGMRSKALEYIEENNLREELLQAINS